MRESMIEQWRGKRKVVIGMCHVPPLPGAPRFGGDLGAVREWVLRDAAALADGGVDGIFVENFGDVPFYPGRVPAHVVSHLTVLAWLIRERTGLPLGINVLRNDGCSALAIAHAVGADFVRVNVLSHARVTDQGVIQSVAHDLLRERAAINAGNVRILADVNVKESTPLGQPLPIEDEVGDTLHRGLADAIIVSGANTGSGADLDELRRAYASAGGAPVFVGSGVTVENIERYLAHADGFIVGTSLKVDGVAANRVDSQRVKALTGRVAVG